MVNVMRAGVATHCVQALYTARLATKARLPVRQRM